MKQRKSVPPMRTKVRSRATAVEMINPALAAATGIVLDPLCLLHEVRYGPEIAARLVAVEAGLKEAGLWGKCTRLPVRDASDAEILLVHTPDYLWQVEHDVLTGAGNLSTGDTELSEHSLTAARRATGSVLAAVDAVVKGRVRNAFCAVRPPGHHASPDRGRGFCIFNHVAIAARYAQNAHGIERVAIIDWDVHHGNGTQDTFYSDPSVLFFSSHQRPLYPGSGARHETGRGSARGLTINVPLRAGSRIDDIMKEVDKRLAPQLEKFRPQLFLICAGFDAHEDDPLGGFRLTAEDFATLTRRVMDFAEIYAAGRIVSVLEGGYDLPALAASVSAHVAAILGR